MSFEKIPVGLFVSFEVIVRNMSINFRQKITLEEEKMKAKNNKHTTKYQPKEYKTIAQFQ